MGWKICVGTSTRRSTRTMFLAESEAETTKLCSPLHIRGASRNAFVHSRRLPFKFSHSPRQEVDGDMFPILNVRLGAGGRYRAHPTNVPLGSRYFTIMFVKVGTVTVHNSGREVRPNERCCRLHLPLQLYFPASIPEKLSTLKCSCYLLWVRS